MAPQFTIGIEEEFQIIDPRTQRLRSHVAQILTEGEELLGDQLKPEMLQSVLEVGTRICKDVKEARDELTKLRCGLASLTSHAGLSVAGSGTHPSSHWEDQAVTPKDRYQQMLHDMQDIARGLTIWGLHVHVYVGERDRLIDIFNEARYFLPHLLALSTSSPFWIGRNTGLKSYRHVIWNQMPRTGIPDSFQSWAHFEDYIRLMVETGCIEDGTKIWWDLRPHPIFNTLEFRICDQQSRIEDTLALAALCQCIVATLWDLRSRNLGFRQYHRAALAENRWRAMRYGIDGKLIDFGKREEVPERQLIGELLDFVDHVVDDLNCREEIEHVRSMLEAGTSADRQLRVWEETRDIDAVSRSIAAETLQGIEAADCELRGVYRQLEPALALA